MIISLNIVHLCSVCVCMCDCDSVCVLYVCLCVFVRVCVCMRRVARENFRERREDRCRLHLRGMLAACHSHVIQRPRLDQLQREVGE